MAKESNKAFTKAGFKIPKNGESAVWVNLITKVTGEDEFGDPEVKTTKTLQCITPEMWPNFVKNYRSAGVSGIETLHAPKGVKTFEMYQREAFQKELEELAEKTIHSKADKKRIAFLKKQLG